MIFQVSDVQNEIRQLVTLLGTSPCLLKIVYTATPNTCNLLTTSSPAERSGNSNPPQAITDGTTLRRMLRQVTMCVEP